MFEEVWRGDLDAAIKHVQDQAPRGEYTLVIAGAASTIEKWALEMVVNALEEGMAEGLTRSQAARKVAQESGWSRRDVYALKTGGKAILKYLKSLVFLKP